eukprot:TRINITY_DN3394_c0_g1_i4.p1 TRINITY_DN3394_c0_g1~~TRINITY_DN3394_c0_g1_i4.p1  ORF type:complete len:983 (+),score=236.39 TRINITY_DN3394_c0_g1_i4:37-2985(+)
MNETMESSIKSTIAAEYAKMKQDKTHKHCVICLRRVVAKSQHFPVDTFMKLVEKVGSPDVFAFLKDNLDSPNNFRVHSSCIQQLKKCNSSFVQWWPLYQNVKARIGVVDHNIDRLSRNVRPVSLDEHVNGMTEGQKQLFEQQKTLISKLNGEFEEVFKLRQENQTLEERNGKLIEEIGLLKEVKPDIEPLDLSNVLLTDESSSDYDYNETKKNRKSYFGEHGRNAVVDIEYLGEQLQENFIMKCSRCKSGNLNLCIEDKKKVNGVFDLKFQCSSCNNIQLLSTSRRVEINEKKVYETVERSIVGNIINGGRYTDYRRRMVSMGIKPVSKDYFRTRMVVVYTHVKVMKEACFTMARVHVMKFCNGIRLSCCSYDAFWQHRSNSSNGTGALVDAATGFILDARHRSFTPLVINEEIIVPSYPGTSASMEHDIFEEILLSDWFSEYEKNVLSFVGDGDVFFGTTLAKYAPDVIRQMDINHLLKNFHKTIGKVQTRNKYACDCPILVNADGNLNKKRKRDHRILTPSEISNFVNSLGGIAREATNDDEFLKGILLGIDHCAGSHVGCGVHCPYKLEVGEDEPEEERAGSTKLSCPKIIQEIIVKATEMVDKNRGKIYVNGKIGSTNVNEKIGSALLNLRPKHVQLAAMGYNLYTDTGILQQFDISFGREGYTLNDFDGKYGSDADRSSGMMFHYKTSLMCAIGFRDDPFMMKCEEQELRTRVRRSKKEQEPEERRRINKGKADKRISNSAVYKKELKKQVADTMNDYRKGKIGVDGIICSLHSSSIDQDSFRMLVLKQVETEKQKERRNRVQDKNIRAYSRTTNLGVTNGTKRRRHNGAAGSCLCGKTAKCCTMACPCHAAGQECTVHCHGGKRNDKCIAGKKKPSLPKKSKPIKESPITPKKSKPIQESPITPKKSKPIQESPITSPKRSNNTPNKYTPIAKRRHIQTDRLQYFLQSEDTGVVDDNDADFSSECEVFYSDSDYSS